MQNLKLNPNLLSVPLYVAGKPIEQVQEEYGLCEVVKLASNENPLGPSPLAMAAYQDALKEAHRYPGVGDRRLRQKLAARYNAQYEAHLTEENFMTGNGLGDVLRMIAEAFIFDGGEAVMCMPTFLLYSLLVRRHGGKCIAVPHKNYQHDLPAMANAITSDTRLFFVCNPNNPTGTLIPRDQINELLASVPPSVVLVFDESYSELVEDPNYSNVLEYIKAGRDNVILLRGFSKIFGMANLRIGYAVGTPAMIEYLHHVQLVFNTGDPVFYAAIAALDDHAHIQRVRELIHTEKRFLYSGLAELDLDYVPTAANFILLPNLLRDAQTIHKGLLQQGVIVRPMDAWGLPNAIRVTIGTRAENVRLLSAMKEVLKR